MNKVSVLIFFLLANFAVGAEVPKSPYIAIVYRYGDAILKHNRDAHEFGQNDLRILYTLSELSNKPIYRDAADAQLKWHLQQGLPTDRPWMLWDRCFQIAPDDARAAALKSNSIRAFAAAFHHTKDDAFLKLIAATLSDAKPNGSAIDQLALAIDAWGAAANVPEPLATKLRRFAESQDEAFLAGPKTSSKDARIAMLCVSRYENAGNVKYRDLIHAAADAYRNEPASEQMPPMTFGHIISLELAAWRSAAKQEYLDSARKYADIAVKRFWTPENPLPTFSKGADTLVLSLLELHLSILHITAVRCPPNTIDR